MIQGCAFAAVAAYYASPGFGAISDAAAGAKAQGGYLFSALTTVFASVALPEIAQRFTRSHKRIDGRDLVFRIGFFALIGVIVDAFYRLMAVIFGDSAHWDVILRKVLVDQFVFAPLVSIPLSAAGFLWRDEGFRFGPTWTTLKGGAFWLRFAPMIVTCWAFWIPTLAAVYAMPARMQFVLFLFAQAAWSLLLVHMAEAE